MSDAFPYADALGPYKIVHVYQPELDLRATLVVDNVAIGPAIGGLRMAEDVTTGECFRLARAMTLKNAAAGLPHGGGKSVLAADPRMPAEAKEARIRCFAAALARHEEYIFGPDMGTNEQCMAWVKDEIGRAVGLPTEIGGIPLDELGATGWGVLHATEVAGASIGLGVSGARVVVQGFGAVGMHAARFLCERGAVLVGACDSRGSVHAASGLDLDALIAAKRQGGSVTDVEGEHDRDPDCVIDMECDVWIPAARPDVITADNEGRLQTKLIVQGANIPLTEAAERALHRRGVLSIPDFIANAGGVICAAVEYAGGGKTEAFTAIEEKIRANTAEMLRAAAEEDLLPREAAFAMARRRVEAAMANRRWRVF